MDINYKDLIEQDEYYYHCEITEEHLITGQQKAMMKAKDLEEIHWVWVIEFERVVE